MKNSFRGLLGCIEAVGVVVQKLARKLLFILIGSQAHDWNLDTLRRDDLNFKTQRSNREQVGIVTLFFIQTPLSELDPSPAHLFGGEVSIWFNLIMGIELMLFVVSILLRRLVESNSENSGLEAKD